MSSPSHRCAAPRLPGGIGTQREDQRPEMRRHANPLVSDLRDESTLPKHIQEVAMLITVRAMTARLGVPVANVQGTSSRAESMEKLGTETVLQ